MTAARDPAAARDLVIGREIAAAESLRAAAFQFEFQSRRAGLRACAHGNQRNDAVDVLTAPAFATIAAGFHDLISRQVERIARDAPRSPSRAARVLRRASRAVAAAVSGYGTWEAPARATFAAQQYCNALSQFSLDLAFASDALAALPARPERVRRRLRAIVRSGARVERRFDTLERRLLSIASPGPAPDGERLARAGDEDQASA